MIILFSSQNVQKEENLETSQNFIQGITHSYKVTDPVHAITSHITFLYHDYNCELKVESCRVIRAVLMYHAITLLQTMRQKWKNAIMSQ